MGIPLAKSSGIELLCHNRNVGIVSEYIGKKILTTPDEIILNTIRIAGLLHDIGKILPNFQEMLLSKGKKRTKNKFQHNEIGWAFIYKYFTYKGVDMEYIANSVYWHHGISNKLATFSSEDILSTITNDEEKLMADFVVNLFGTQSILTEPRNDVKSPRLYQYGKDDYNQTMSFIRTCVISADRLVSGWEENNKNIIIDDDILVNYFGIEFNKRIASNDFSITTSPYADKKRFENQLINAKKCTQTTIFKAPAGYGKTLIGLMFASFNKRKTIWVVPRNNIATSIYNQIIQELDKFNIKGITVELFLTGNVVDRNHDTEGEFNSDIIVTNIDNFEAPSVTDSIGDRQFLINTANVVFDEYHEFASTAPYFANFINIMRIRSRFTNSRTLLLSATPIDISYMWETLGRKTTILPNKHQHYPAAHQIGDTYHVVDEFNPELVQESDFVMFNSISESQYYKSILPNSMLYHSGFEGKQKNEKFKYLFKNFGKEADINGKKMTIVGALIMQSSLDISCQRMFCSVLSPEVNVQAKGRNHRFAEWVNGGDFTVFKLQSRRTDGKRSRAESSMIETLYTKELSEKWFLELKKINGEKITLDEFYVIYNSHVEKNKDERKKFFDNQYRDSSSELADVYPIRYYGDFDRTVITAGSNKLRSSGSEIFFIVNWHDDNKRYVEPFNTPIYKSIGEDFNETGNILGRLIGSMTTIMKGNNNELDYSKILKNKKNITIDEVRKYGKKSNTPYIRYDKVYHPDYGLISIVNLEEIIKKKS